MISVCKQRMGSVNTIMLSDNIMVAFCGISGTMNRRRKNVLGSFFIFLNNNAF